MRFILAALAALMLASPGIAADRPVGPETGQARTADDDSRFGSGPDEGETSRPSPPAPTPEIPPSAEGAPRELGWRCDYWPWNRFCGGHRPGGM